MHRSPPSCIKFIDRQTQKIDKIKAQLTAMANLIKPSLLDVEHAEEAAGEDDLDEEELEILREAGVVPRSRSKGKGKKPRHIVFVDDEAAGIYYDWHDV